MDVAYDHIQEEVLSPDEAAEQQANKQQSDLNTEFQEAYKSFSASPWGAKLGGFFGNVKKQSESYYQGARQEASAASEEALKGFTDLRSTLVSRARSLSNQNGPEGDQISTTRNEDAGQDVSKPAADKERTESEALRESEGLISRFRAEAAKRLKDIEKAEDAADEALVKFGANIRNFLRDAVTIAPPTEEKDKDGNNKVLFESKDQDGKRVIHTTRFDAQLHAIHSSLDSFTKEPISPEYEKWKSDFDVEKKTDEISSDLEKYEELRRTMEKLVPEKVDYEQFWKRYYFLRMVIESEEQRRRELLKGAALSPEEPIAWDEDSDSDSEPSTPQPKPRTLTSTTNSSSTILPAHAASSSSSTITAPSNSLNPTETPTSSAEQTVTTDSLKPTTINNEPQPRRSQDQHSQPDSDASYDLVSGATSRAPGSPKEEKEKSLATAEGKNNNNNNSNSKKEGAVAEESDEEDWE